MKINFKYSYVSDIIYHIFAHMKVRNASDLFDESYIEMMNSQYLIAETESIAKYYNEFYNRLMPIQFILIDNFESILNLSFNENDKKYFISPFMEILRREDKSYREYWNNIAKSDEYQTEIAAKFEEVVWRFDKDIDIYLSFSITKNGRGILSPHKYQAIVPYPFHGNPRYDINHCFYMALHELTHQITDKTLNMNMDDGSHNLSERLVIETNYEWLNDKESYLKWLNGLN